MCTRDVGLVCWDVNQPGKICRDFRVRFLCPSLPSRNGKTCDMTYNKTNTDLGERVNIRVFSSVLTGGRETTQDANGIISSPDAGYIINGISKVLEREWFVSLNDSSDMSIQLEASHINLTEAECSLGRCHFRLGGWNKSEKMERQFEWKGVFELLVKFIGNRRFLKDGQSFSLRYQTIAKNSIREFAIRFFCTCE